MSTYTNTLVLELLVRSNELSKGLKQAGNDARAANDQMNQFRESASRALSFIGSIGLGAGVFVGIKKATQAYGEFINQAATAKQVFGESFNELEASMGDAVQQFGLSNTEFLKSTTLLAGLGKSAGIAEKDLAKFSTTLTSLASDLAAAFNTDVTDAVAAIQSGFSGSSIEPLRKYNIVLNDTILKNEYFALSGEKVTGVLTQQQRMAAFLSKLYKESADYQGQWARESDQFNGTMQRLKATVGNVAVEVGSSFEPAVTSAANAMIPLIGAATDVNSSLGGLPVTLALFAGALVALRTPLTVVDAGLVQLTQRSAAFGPTLTKSANAARIATNTIAAIGSSTFIAAAAFTAFSVQTAVARKRTDEFNKAVRELGTGSSEEQIKSLTTVLEELSRSADKDYDFSEVWKGTIKATKDVEAEYRKLLDTAPEVAQALLAIAKRGGEGAATIQQYGLTIDEMQSAIQDANAAAEQQATLQDEIDTILAANGATVERNAKAWDDYSDALEGVADRADDATDSLLDAADAAQEIFESTGSLDTERLKIFQELGTWIEEGFAPLEEGESALDRAITNGENFSSVLDQISTAADTAAIGLEGVAAVDAKVEFLQSVRNDIAAISPEFAALVDGLIADLQGVQVDISLTGDAAQAQLDAFIESNTDKQVVADMLIDSGMAEEQVNTFLKTMSDDQVIEVTTRAITKLAEEDLGALNDEERVTEVVVNALVEEAKGDIEEVVKPRTSDAYIAEAELKAKTDEFITEVNRVRRIAGKEIVVPIRSGAATTSSGGADGNPATPGRAAPLSLVSAGQPIVNNTYVTVPTADPSATMRAIQRWSRNNGAIPVSRGRG
jgi:hypothetical protein